VGLSQVWGRIWPLHWNASLTEGPSAYTVRDVIAEVVAHGPSPVGISGRVISLWAETPCSPNRSIPGFTAPATMESVGRMGGNQKGFSAIGECGVGNLRRTERRLLTATALHLKGQKIADCEVHRLFEFTRPVFCHRHIRRHRVSRVYRRKAGSPAQTSQLQPEAQPSRPASRLQTVSVSERDLDPDGPHCFKPLRPLKASCAEPHRSVALARHPGPDRPHPRSRPSASRTSGPRRRSRALHPRSRSRGHHSPRLVCSMGSWSKH
jgi:hypothetical protein